MFLRGPDTHGGEFLDLVKTLDISATGAYVVASRPLRHNDLVSLTIPAPPPGQSGLVPAAMSPIQARVRRVEAAGELHLLGVEFTRPLD